MTNCRKRPFDFSSTDVFATGPYVVIEVKSNKVKIMSIKDYTQVKVVTELNRLVPYKESYKLSFFESVASGVEKTRSPSTTFQIITCDSQYTADELTQDEEGSFSHVDDAEV